MKVRNFNFEQDMEEREERTEGVDIGKEHVVNREKLRVLKYKAMKLARIKEFIEDTSGVASTSVDMSSVSVSAVSTKHMSKKKGRRTQYSSFYR